MNIILCTKFELNTELFIVYSFIYFKCGNMDGFMIILYWCALNGG